MLSFVVIAGIVPAAVHDDVAIVVAAVVVAVVVCLFLCCVVFVTNLTTEYTVDLAQKLTTEGRLPN